MSINRYKFSNSLIVFLLVVISLYGALCYRALRKVVNITDVKVIKTDSLRIIENQDSIIDSLKSELKVLKYSKQKVDTVFIEKRKANPIPKKDSILDTNINI